MAKKKAGQKRAEKVGTEMPSGKVALQLRFDAGIAALLGKMAERTGVSLSQLMNAMGAWMIQHAHPGKEPTFPVPENRRIVGERSQEGMIWFGKESTDAYDNEDLEGSPRMLEDGLVFGVLDFTVRRVLREE